MISFLDPIMPMATDLTPLLLHYFLIFARISIFVFLMPGLGETMIPVQVRLLVSLAIAVLLMSVGVLPYGGSVPSPASYGASLFIESIKGFALGLSLRMFIFVLQFAGSFISQLLSLSQAFGIRSNSDNDPLISSLFVISATALAVTLELHTEVVILLQRTYISMPIGEAIDLTTLTYWLTQKAAGVFTFSLSLSLPFVALSFVYNLVLGAANRAMPQLMVAFVGMPAITLLGIVMLGLLSGGILTLWAHEFGQLLAEIGS